MLTLHDLQRLFRDAIFTAPAPALLAAIQSTDLRPEQRLRVYRNNIRTTLAEGLAAIYPVTRQLVGEGFFRTLARDCFTTQPPDCADLNHVGGGLSAFLAVYAPATALPYLPDMAALEWALHGASHAADATPLSAAALAGLTEEDAARLRLSPHPSARLLRCRHPVDRIWEAHQQPDVPEIRLEHGTEFALLALRPRDRLLLIRLSPGEYAWLAALHGNAALPDAYAAALTAGGAEESAAWLAKHLQLGSFTAYSLQP